jgi:hypothetical protein
VAKITIVLLGAFVAILGFLELFRDFIPNILEPFPIPPEIGQGPVFIVIGVIVLIVGLFVGGRRR